MKDPAVLLDGARDTLVKLGYPDESSLDEACGFDGDANRSPIFWYRRRPGRGSLIVNELHCRQSDVLGTFGRTEVSIPAWGTAGEVGMILSPDRSLRWFRAVPPAVLTTHEGGEHTSDDSLSQAEKVLKETFGFEEVGTFGEGHRRLKDVFLPRTLELDLEVPTPPDPFDVLSIWRSSGDDLKYYVVATFNGRLSFVDALVESPGTQKPVSRFVGLLDAVRLNFWNAYLLVITVIACVLFFRHFRLGRVDRRTAFRGSAYIFAVSMLVWLISAHHGPLIREHEVLRLGAAQALLFSGVFAVWYIAVEPLVRKTWPECLVTWVRLISGRIADPLVGRDLLIGAMAGILCNLILQIAIFTPDCLGLDVPVHLWKCWWWTPLNGSVEAFSEVLRWQVSASYICPCLLAFLVLLRIPLRSEWGTMLVFVVFLNIVLFEKDMWVVNLIQQTLCWTVLAYLVFRYGLLTFVVGWYTYILLTHFPLTAQIGKGYWGASGMALLVVLFFAVYGFYMTVGGRKGLANISLRAAS